MKITELIELLLKAKDAGLTEVEEIKDMIGLMKK